LPEPSPAPAEAAPKSASSTAAGYSARSSSSSASLSHKVRVSARNKTIGALLVSERRATEEQVDKALAAQREEGGLTGQILVRLGYCKREDIGAVLKKQRTITTVRLATLPVPKNVLSLLTRDFCLKHKVLPFELLDTQLCVAMTNVLDTAAKTDLRSRLPYLIKTFDADWQDLHAAIDRCYRRGGAAEELEVHLPEEPPAPAGAPDAPSAPAPAKSAADETARRFAAEDGQGPLRAIPVAEAFVMEVVQWDRADSEPRWLATHLPDNVLPMLPAPAVPDGDGKAAGA
jgi:hypothetical protein